MTSLYTKSIAQTIRKKQFHLKTADVNGLILRIHHMITESDKIRFLYACYVNTGHVLAVADRNGYVFIIDLSVFKFWGLPNFGSCTVLKFSVWNDNELLIGLNSGTIAIVNIHTGTVSYSLEGHKFPVTEISFSKEFLCITSSQHEAVIWDLKSNCRLQILNLETKCVLKHVLFVPVSSNILGCFHDNEIHIWKYGTFEKLKVISPTLWNKFSVKTISFTRNGQIALIAGHSSHIAMFLLSDWSRTKILTLPNYIMSVKYMDFIPQPFDGGCNRLLGVLSGSGSFYFYDSANNCILHSISVSEEIIKFTTSNDGKYLACVLCSGEVHVYNIEKYTLLKKNPCAIAKSVNKTAKSKKQLYRKHIVRQQLSGVMDIDKLRAILKEFGQYPDSYRLTIWKHLLQLPDNKDQYNSIINRFAYPAFENLENEYPLENKAILKNLKRALNNVVTWCPFFAHVKYLPVLIFPFVKIFQSEPVLCFEIVCTLLVNWCQHWFEYFPLPPINILAMMENILYEHDLQLLQHLTLHNVTSEIYAWPLLESAFSEVLTASEWCVIWDHILTNEPSFLLMGVIAYNILNRSTLFSFTNLSDFKHFYHHQNLIDIKRLVAKTYLLYKNTSDKNHPRSYLNAFTCLEKDKYPRFVGYPAALVDYENIAKENIKKQREEIEKKESDLFTRRLEDYRQLIALEVRNEENARLQELEKVYRKKVAEEQERVRMHHERLLELQKQLHEEEVNILTECRSRIVQQNTAEKQRKLERLIEELQSNVGIDVEVKQAEQDVLNHYAQLMRHKLQIEKLLMQETSMENAASQQHVLLLEQQDKLSEEIEKIRRKASEKIHLKQLNIATGIATIDDLIQHVEMELTKETSRNQNHNNLNKSDKVSSLETETKELEAEVTKLLALLAKAKTEKQKQTKNDSTQNNLKKGRSLKNLVHMTRNGYEAPPTSPDFAHVPPQRNV